MGFCIKFECQSCRYEGSLSLGSGRMSYNKSFKWPVLCSGCHSLTVANYLVDPLACSSCGSEDVKRIDAPEVSLGEGSKAEINHHSKFGDLTYYTDELYLCPKCGEFGLKFADYPHLLWD